MRTQNSTHISGYDSSGDHSATALKQADNNNDDPTPSSIAQVFTAAADGIDEHRYWLRNLTTNLHRVEGRHKTLAVRVSKLEEELAEERRQRRALERSLRQVGRERCEESQQNGGESA